jgi:hypothetical protein
MADAIAALAEYEVWLAPARKEWLSARMKALFARFWIADLDASTHGFVFADTLYAVREFPEWAIAEVCHEWIANKTTRPHAAELVGRCRAPAAPGCLYRGAQRKNRGDRGSKEA